MAQPPPCQLPYLQARSIGRSIGAQGAAMASVFLSYDRDDTDRARHFARALEKEGHSVWWDLHVRGGAQFGKVIEEALKAADAVVVLWSSNSVESAWVKDEAAAGRDSGRLVPVSIDGTPPPLGFRQFQTLDLSNWRGRGTPAQLRTLFADIDALGRNNGAGGASIASPPPPPRQPPILPEWRTRIAAVAVLALLVAAAAAYWFAYPRPASTSVAVVPADASQLSRQMARDLLVKIGVLQGRSVANLNLTGGEPGNNKADFTLSVSGAQRGNLISASVALIGRGDVVQWSKQLEQPLGQSSRLGEALAFAAARVVECAVEEGSGTRGRLPERLRRTYLNACAAMGEAGWENSGLLPMLKQVTEQAPRFEPAWGKLILAQIDYVSSLDGDEQAAARAELKKFVDEARKFSPGLAEATIAELTLNPSMPVGRAVALVERARTDDPSNAAVLLAHANQMQRVGLMSAAIEDSQRAVELDPLSPYTRAQFVTTLLYSGNTERARAELANAKRLWPDAPAIDQADFALEVRTGNAAEAALTRGTGMGTSLFVKLLRDPSDGNVAAFLTYVRADPRDLGRMGWAMQTLGQLDRTDEFYSLVRDFRPYHYAALRENSDLLFRPWMAGIRRDPRFLDLVGRIGLVDYWRSSGNWPDFCRDPQLPYDCKKEAARLAA